MNMKSFSLSKWACLIDGDKTPWQFHVSVHSYRTPGVWVTGEGNYLIVKGDLNYGFNEQDFITHVG